MVGVEEKKISFGLKNDLSENNIPFTRGFFFEDSEF